MLRSLAYAEGRDAPNSDKDPDGWTVLEANSKFSRYQLG